MPINTKIHSGGLADNAVSTDKIAGDAVTTAKVADDAVSSAKIADDAVTTAKVADDAITGTLIENNPTVAGNLTVAGTSTLTGNAVASGNLTVTGNLTVSGTQTTINTATLEVEDKDITIAKVATPTDVTAADAGVIIKGTTDKTLLWKSATNSLSSNVKVAENAGSSAFHRPLTTMLALG